MHAEEETEKRTALSSLDSILLRSVQHPEHVGQTLPPRSAGAGDSDGLTVDGQPERDQNMPREARENERVQYPFYCGRENAPLAGHRVRGHRNIRRIQRKRERERNEKKISRIFITIAQKHLQRN